MDCRQLALLAGMACGCLSVAQGQTAPQPYMDADAYQIYSLLIPNEEVWHSKTRLIEQETVTSAVMDITPESCIDPTVSEKFRDSITDYHKKNKQRWLLQRQFPIDIPYQLDSSDTLKAVFDEGKLDASGPGGPIEAGRDAFRRRYPEAGGIIVLSAVGFNADRTRALVYSGASCGSLCGRWTFHLFEKVDGKWQGVPGIGCHVMS
jgi:hypothetical protein